MNQPATHSRPARVSTPTLVAAGALFALLVIAGLVLAVIGWDGTGILAFLGGLGTVFAGVVAAVEAASRALSRITSGLNQVSAAVNGPLHRTVGEAVQTAMVRVVRYDLPPIVRREVSAALNGDTARLPLLAVRGVAGREGTVWTPEGSPVNPTGPAWAPRDAAPRPRGGSDATW